MNKALDRPLRAPLLSTPDMRPIMHLIGIMLIATGGMMVFPAGLDLIYEDANWRPFGIAAASSAVGGVILIRLANCELSKGLNLRQAFILTPLSWLAIAFVGSFPFFFSNVDGLTWNLTNSFFESMSGLTTTGSTILVGLDGMAPGVLLWRAQLQWMGGIGIIATAIAILPALGIGGMQLFRTESSDRSEKVMPRVRQIAAAIVAVYVALTALAGLSYWLAGMTPFEAVAHALTTISTGGYSTSDGSFGNWSSPTLQWLGTLFMLSGAIPFVLYVRFLAGERRALWDHQVRTLLALLMVVIVLMTLGLIWSGQYDVEPALRYSAFNIISIVTTTGYATTDYSLWGNAAMGVFLALTFVGGCTGSTSGGIKIFRFEVMALLLRTHFLRLLYPRGVFPRTYAGRLLQEDVVGSVIVFFTLYFICYAGLTIALMAMDLDFLTSASAAATSLSNVGPGLGSTIGPAGNFATMPPASKWLLSFAMLLGRLEIFTVLMLLFPRFWRG